MYSPMIFAYIILSLSCSAGSDSDLWYLHQYVRQADRKFEQKTNRFWEFQEQSNSWVEVELPFNLVSCVNDNCSKVGLVDQRINRTKDTEELDVSEPKKSSKMKDYVKTAAEENFNTVLPFRKRVSLTKMFDTSIWITGPSGSIYERFWNGMQWVIAPHELPLTAGYAISVFIVNQTILALSEAGNLYQVVICKRKHIAIFLTCTPKKLSIAHMIIKCLIFYGKENKKERRSGCRKEEKRTSAINKFLHLFYDFMLNSESFLSLYIN